MRKPTIYFAAALQASLLLSLWLRVWALLTLLDLTSEQLVQGTIEWIGLSKMQLYSKSWFFELDKWNFGSSIVLVSF